MDWKALATRDPERITKLWTDPITTWEQPFNIGIATGDGLVVIDIDVKDGKSVASKMTVLELMYGPLPETYSIDTPSGGRHLYFTTAKGIEIGNSVGKLLAGVDVRAHSGLVVAPGSRIGDRYYQRRTDAREELAALPSGILAEAIREGHKQRTREAQGVLLRPGDYDHPAAVDRAVEYLKTVEPAVEGAGGDNHTIVVANGVLDFGLSIDKATEILDEHWNVDCSPPWDPAELRQKVENAAKSRQEPIGNRAVAEIEFGPVELAEERPPLAVENIGLFEWSTKQSYLVRGLLNYGMIGFVTGLPNVGKSPLALDLAANIAKGEPWRGMKLKKGYVLHVSTEGWTGLRNRFEALRREHGLAGEGVPLDFVARSIDLRNSSKDAKAIAATATTRASHFGLPAAMVVIDTLSHAMGGASDSDDDAARAVIKNCRLIAEATGAAVVLLHHPTKSASSSLRGSSVWSFDTDLVMEVVSADATITNDSVRTITTPRTKEFAQITPQKFCMKVLELGKDGEGDAITSVVVDWTVKEFTAGGPTPEDEAALDALEEALEETDAPKNGVRYSDWFVRFVTVCRGAGVGAPKGSRDKWLFNRVRTRLVQLGFVSKTHTGQYVRTDLVR